MNKQTKEKMSEYQRGALNQAMLDADTIQKEKRELLKKLEKEIKIWKKDDFVGLEEYDDHEAFMFVKGYNQALSNVLDLIKKYE